MMQIYSEHRDAIMQTGAYRFRAKCICIYAYYSKNLKFNSNISILIDRTKNYIHLRERRKNDRPQTGQIVD